VKATHRYLSQNNMERHIPQQYRRENYDALTDSDEDEDKDFEE
jgi:hypothetical protein